MPRPYGGEGVRPRLRAGLPVVSMDRLARHPVWPEDRAALGTSLRLPDPGKRAARQKSECHLIDRRSPRPGAGLLLAVAARRRPPGSFPFSAAQGSLPRPSPFGAGADLWRERPAFTWRASPGWPKRIRLPLLAVGTDVLLYAPERRRVAGCAHLHPARERRRHHRRPVGSQCRRHSVAHRILHLFKGI